MFGIGEICGSQDMQKDGIMGCTIVICTYVLAKVGIIVDRLLSLATFPLIGEVAFLIEDWEKVVFLQS